MIQINLLPEADKKGRGRKTAKAAGAGSAPFGSAVVAMAAVAVVVIVGGTGYNSWSGVHEVKAKVAKLVAEKQVVEEEIGQLSDEAREIRRLRQVFSNQWEVLQSLDPPNRILWSEKINMLANLMPAEIFLSEIDLKETVLEIEIQASIDARQKWSDDGKRGTEPLPVKKPIITYTLQLKGLATGPSGVEQFNNVIRFHDALVAHESVDETGTKRRFMENFNPSIEFESVKATLYEGVPVNEFIFRLRTIPAGTGGKPNAPVATAGTSRKRPLG